MSLLKSYLVSFTSLLAGASVVHYILQPDLSIPIETSRSTTTTTTLITDKDTSSPSKA